MKASMNSNKDIRMSTIKLKRMQTFESAMVNLVSVEGDDDVDL